MAKDKSWRPRHGASLSVERIPGWVERTAVKHISKLPRLFLYGPVALILAWILSYSGKGEVQLKGAGAVALALWLSVDLWHYLLRRKWQWRFVTGWTGAGLLLIGAMMLMWFWLDEKLEAQRNDVWSHLAFNHFIPPGFEDDPVFTDFTVKNESGYRISTKHGITCLTNIAVGNNGTSLRENMSTWIMDDKTMAFSGVVHTFDRPPAASIIDAGGDAESDQCLRALDFKEGTDCIDVTIIFWYTLETEPDAQQEKRIRFIADKGRKGQFAWHQESLGTPTTHCASYYNANNPVPAEQKTGP